MGFQKKVPRVSEKAAGKREFLTCTLKMSGSSEKVESKDK